MTEAEIQAVLEATGVIRRGHFRLTSGKHSDVFLLCTMVAQHPRHLERLAAEMAAPFRGAGVEVVVGPAMGGILFAYEVARTLGARAIFTEKSDGGMALRRGFAIAPGERVLVVEDAISTAGSVRNVLAAIAPMRPTIVGVSALVDRSGGRADPGAPVRAALRLDVGMWDPQACPLCRAGVPLTEPKA
ncbi:MAG: orotate phosphoribosyltransferase [Armatimonadetes bacterium]|nr:orotate phosphoribosyltransferase [Armatimonadota bacterium]